MFTELEQARIEKLLDHFCRWRVPEHAAERAYYVYRVYDDNVEIVELRPQEKRYAVEVPAVRLQCSGERRRWTIQWMRDDLAWHDYESTRVLHHLEDALAEVELDPFRCFFGQPDEA